jgi:hypothetical protein
MIETNPGIEPVRRSVEVTCRAKEAFRIFIGEIECHGSPRL